MNREHVAMGRSTMNDEDRVIPVRMQVYATSIPMRTFEHAAAERALAEAAVVRVDFAGRPGGSARAGGLVGWGETLPRAYVTGETLETVVEDLEGVFWPALAGRPCGPEDVARAQGAAGGDRCRNAAACAAELAILDAMLTRDPHLFSHRRAAAEAGAESGGAAGCLRPAGDALRGLRVSGVLGSSDPARTARALRKMRWYGLRDFKLKLGFAGEIDAENLRVAHRQLRRGLRAGRYTLRVDVNSAWPADSVPDRVARLAEYGVCVVEQPADVRPDEMVTLARRCALPLMADETLLTARDAAVLADEPRVWWSIRMCKNGGLLPALDLCRLAAERGVPFTLGCLVGESGILSGAQRRLLGLAPPPRFVEGNYGRFLLRDDLTRPSPRFGYGGRMKPLRGPGWGVRVDEEKLRRYGRLVKTLTA